jgi:hypothetical protein
LPGAKAGADITVRSGGVADLDRRIAHIGRRDGNRAQTDRHALQPIRSEAQTVANWQAPPPALAARRSRRSNWTASARTGPTSAGEISGYLIVVDVEAVLRCFILMVHRCSTRPRCWCRWRWRGATIERVGAAPSGPDRLRPPVSYRAWRPQLPATKCSRPQASRITLAESRRSNNSTGHDLAHHVSRPGVLKLFESGFESFAHGRDHFRSERSRLHQWTNLHGRRPSAAPAMVPRNY